MKANPEVDIVPLSEDPSVDALNPLGTNTVEYKSDPSAYAAILKETSQKYNAVIRAYESLESDFVAKVAQARADFGQTIESIILQKD